MSEGRKGKNKDREREGKKGTGNCNYTEKERATGKLKSIFLTYNNFQRTLHYYYIFCNIVLHNKFFVALSYWIPSTSEQQRTPRPTSVHTAMINDEPPDD